MNRDGNHRNDPPGWETLPWDSACFGFPVARLRAGLGPDALAAGVSALRAAGIRLAYWNADPGDAAGLAAALSLGGTVVDERLEYALAPVPEGEAGRVLEAAGKGWDAALEGLALHAGLYSRFRTDPRFPQDRFRDLYREWMRKSLTGELADAVLALPGASGPEAMITVAARDGAGSIGLIAVEPGREGRGLGSELIRAAAAWFRDRGCARATVATQGANRAARALYERHGYRIAQRAIAHHFWL